ncbi:NAD(P)/FAD-dependent oxidoreductase [Faunimonas sp. B44]|uniref:NAD(P)/FAD-dependent oxidoreductase n=1 Tax=Faunimonas sp. B44 TaxID=3461493 RepID=UPI004044359E
MNDRVVIVGAGQAGGWLAATIRQLQPDRPVTLVGAEDHPPYERPPLSKGILLGKADAASAYIKPHSFYDDNRIGLILGVEALRIDRAGKRVELSDGTTIAYDTLAITTGLRPRTLPVPGAGHPKLRYLRTLADLAAIRDDLAPGRHVVAIGAGFVGLEVAAAAIASGCRVTVVEAAPHALNRVMAAEVAEAIVLRHRSRGVTFLFGAAVAAIGDDGGAPVVELADGRTVRADMVLCGIGGVANDGLARAAGLDYADGIVVDEAGRTSDPAIYAAGDVTAQMSLALGRRIRLESWQNAQNQAIAVGRHIAGAPEPYDEVPWFWTDQYEFNFQMVGLPECWDRIVWRGAPGDDKFTAIYLADGRVVGGNTMNNARDIRPLRQMVQERTPIDADLLADIGVSLIKLQKTWAAP